MTVALFRIPAGSDPDTTYTPVRGRIRLGTGETREVEVAVPHNGSLCDEELNDAALSMLGKRFPGCAWDDASAGGKAAPGSSPRPSPTQLARLKRLVAYFAVFVLAFAPLMIATSYALRTALFEAECSRWGASRGLTLLGFTGHGGELFGSPSMFAASCNFGGAHNQVAFREIAGTTMVWLERFSGFIVVLAGLVGGAIVVAVIATITESLVARSTTAGKQ